MTDPKTNPQSVPWTDKQQQKMGDAYNKVANQHDDEYLKKKDKHASEAMKNSDSQQVDALKKKEALFAKAKILDPKNKAHDFTELVTNADMNSPKSPYYEVTQSYIASTTKQQFQEALKVREGIKAHKYDDWEEHGTTIDKDYYTQPDPKLQADIQKDVTAQFDKGQNNSVKGTLLSRIVKTAGDPQKYKSLQDDAAHGELGSDYDDTNFKTQKQETKYKTDPPPAPKPDAAPTTTTPTTSDNALIKTNDSASHPFAGIDLSKHGPIGFQGADTMLHVKTEVATSTPPKQVTPTKEVVAAKSVSNSVV